MKSHVVLLLILLLSSLNSASAQSDDADCSQARLFTFSWQFSPACDMQARGGTTQGAELELAEAPSDAWQALQNDGLEDFERDRMAILSMAGGYRVSFDFLETVGYTPGFEPDRPYQSWATEYVYVIEDRDDFISLQHIMVMQYVDESGNVSAPMVQKHWRQDWQYEPSSIRVFNGLDEFVSQPLVAEEMEGVWSQSVYQVDDSPRYAAVGRWQHDHNISSWLSSTTWRPLPRRESSVRQDYQVLVGTNRHTITPTGWVQEEENFKVALDAPGQLRESQPYLSKELGVARYERLADFDFTAGDEYWQATEQFWRDVRAVWQEYIDADEAFVFSETANGMPLFVSVFGLAGEAAEATAYDASASRAQIRALLADYVTLQP
ncbi:MAG: hypothetical protein CMQ37_08705 [Gammaproteobacteria bacterium]|nr:hypothetical protein [Gammaproteobacteria bacterium]|tara:strand:- start:1612 stop:2748 length:1137 start_codon:yes stop_codon:yes gene_type:complete